MAVQKESSTIEESYTTELKFTATHSTSIDIMHQTDDAVIIVIIDKQTEQAAN
jgi:hypothetical protein